MLTDALTPSLLFSSGTPLEDEVRTIVEIMVWDKDMLSDDFLGFATVPLEDLEAVICYSFWTR